MKSPFITIQYLVGGMLLLFTSLGRAADKPVDFAKQIAPLLERHCLRCHSADNSKGDVSLATFADLEKNQFVIAGDPAGSQLMGLITASDGGAPAMPQDGVSLNAEEVALIAQWIQEGAVWPKETILREKSKADTSWWSLQPVVRTLPPVSSAWPESWKRNPIDAFIMSKLQSAELQPHRQADRATLIRRLSFGLHGIPPTPEAVAAFQHDPDPQAYEKLVDRLLESPRYGERFAQHWLDIAHYADTHGFERDMRRANAWRYRDYVINALNADKPYDRFLQEQLAGDVLWPEDEQAVIATGFLAAGPWDFVGQVETKSPTLRRGARALDLDDMVTQVMTATMGLTANCARCHDHKLDPISQQEYYQLQAVFAGVKRDNRVVSSLAKERYEADKKQLSKSLDEIDLELAKLEDRGLDLADLVGGGKGLGTGIKRQGIDARTGKTQARDLSALDDVKVNHFAEVDSDFIHGVFIPDGEAGNAAVVVGSSGLRLQGLPKTSRQAWDAIRNGPVASQHSPELSGIDFTKEGHSLLGLHANAGITFDLGKMRTALGHAALRFTTKLGYFGASGGFHADVWIFLDDRLVREFASLKREDGLQEIDLSIPDSVQFLTLVATDGGNGYSHDQIGFGDPKIAAAVPRSPGSDVLHALEQLRQQRKAVAEKLASLSAPPLFYGVVAEPTVPEVFVLSRGDPESPIGEALEPAAFSALTMLQRALGTHESDAGQRRAALARWITHPENPLVRRVIVNRLWQWHFGHGIVNTPSDFGFGGGLPSHPELLDWLAVELAEQKWSLKSMHRLILTSAAYQQDSRVPAHAPGVAIDADNRLLWRQNPRRLEAETIRDAVLSVSGNLNLQAGGPGFEDFQYTEAYAPIYAYITADQPSLWRRSIYRYIVRTTPDRFLTTFDCPDPANFTPKRLTTTTPLQSLALFNNEFILRQAEYFAARIERESSNLPEDQASRAFALAFGRLPTEQERSLAGKFIIEQGLLAFCRSLLNANEFLYVD